MFGGALSVNSLLSRCEEIDGSADKEDVVREGENILLSTDRPEMGD